MHCPKCSSIIKDEAETCRFCKAEITEADRKKELALRPAPTLPKSKQIKETKATCQACGNVWFYGKQDQTENFGNAMSNCGKSLMCCSGCWPALFMHDKDVVDLGKCPKCGSRAVNKEIVVHNV